MKRPDEVTEYLRCGGANCDGACQTQFDRIGVEDCKTWRVHGYVEQLEKRIVHLESLNQQNLSVITMQERTRARLEERISQLESNVPRWISVEDEYKGLESDALSYIQQLETKCHQLERERDALLADLSHADYIGNCDHCINNGNEAYEAGCYAADCDCETCKKPCPCASCRDGDKWQWRGVKEE